jgi:hypothetical protein
MIFIDDVPKSGVLVVTVFFKGYKDYYQNESRKELRDQVPKIDKDNNLGVSLEPLQFCLVRKVTEEGRARSIGVLYTFSYANMTPDKFKVLFKELTELLGKKAKWSHHDIMVASNVGGI